MPLKERFLLPKIPFLSSLSIWSIRFCLPPSFKIYAILSPLLIPLLVISRIFGDHIFSHLSSPANNEPPTKPPIPAVKYLEIKSSKENPKSKSSDFFSLTLNPKASAPFKRAFPVSCMASSIISSIDSLEALLSIILNQLVPLLDFPKIPFLTASTAFPSTSAAVNLVAAVSAALIAALSAVSAVANASPVSPLANPCLTFLSHFPPLRLVASKALWNQPLASTGVILAGTPFSAASSSFPTPLIVFTVTNSSLRREFSPNSTSL